MALEISKVLTISTAHISEETAKLMDDETGFRWGLVIY